MSAVIIQLLVTVSGIPTPIDGQWVVEYDPTRPGRGPNGEEMSAHLVTTPDRARARRFEPAEAFATYRLAHGTRGDGKPDRPMTAWMVEFERVDE